MLEKNSVPPAKHYADWKEMLQKEDIEAVVMGAPEAKDILTRRIASARAAAKRRAVKA